MKDRKKVGRKNGAKIRKTRDNKEKVGGEKGIIEEKGRREKEKK